MPFHEAQAADEAALGSAVHDRMFLYHASCVDRCRCTFLGKLEGEVSWRGLMLAGNTEFVGIRGICDAIWNVPKM